MTPKVPPLAPVRLATIKNFGGQTRHSSSWGAEAPLNRPPVRKYAVAYEYEENDCVFIDNLAVAHRAAPDAGRTKTPPEAWERRVFLAR